MLGSSNSAVSTQWRTWTSYGHLAGRFETLATSDVCKHARGDVSDVRTEQFETAGTRPVATSSGRETTIAVCQPLLTTRTAWTRSPLSAGANGGATSQAASQPAQMSQVKAAIGRLMAVG